MKAKGEMFKHLVSLDVFESYLNSISRDTVKLLHQDKFYLGVQDAFVIIFATPPLAGQPMLQEPVQDNDAPVRIIPSIRRRAAARSWQLSLPVSIPEQQIVNCRKNFIGNDLVTMYLARSASSTTSVCSASACDGSCPVPGTPQGI
ncbi:low-density lipoprotein receptor [Culex quinquefasciatus]|uniref:Low-density lipoprotein receptor n=1 Tax=Culex quinquefasciatus TaxID=7176 RepID=B0WFE4_CULQU|nr:low-density lipoprotein receptor [Culex quinquefasciatus]|eukprot:XP_001847428.1 low-density lipoprotein receptor [Culex quinquefasciatus]